MATWNMFSPEVEQARAFLRKLTCEYGKHCAARLKEDSYKAQALVELSRRLEADEKIARLRNKVLAAIDVLEELQDHKDAAVAGAASRALQKIGAQE